jgi:probable F420-dependent oxidoreductase
MKVGVFATHSARTMPVAEFARELEARAVESMWVGEHTHVPVATTTEGYHDQRMLDVTKEFPSPLVLLAVAAAVTLNLRVGTSVCLVAQHDPLVLAKGIATLDVVSGGRFELGCGYGWNRAEMQNHGVSSSTRRAIFREKLRTMQALWTEEIAEFSGDHVSFSPSWSGPKPIQQPHPPVLIGAPAHPSVVRDIVELADGWMPSAYFAVDTLHEQLAYVRAESSHAGRDQNGLRVTLLETATAAGSLSPVDFAARWAPTARLRRWQDLGVYRVVIGVPANERDSTLRILDDVAELSRKLA